MTGDQDAMANLRKIAAALGDDQMREFAIEALEPVAETARSLVPVRSGVTKEGIVVSGRLPDGGEAEFNGKAAFVGVLEGGSFWGWFVELGTVKVRAEPFLIPAVDAETDHVFDILGQLAGRAIMAAV
ncbi:HK97 gp10 family phage protein [Novosphingobium chloroacetimidivorans]|uniref:HK97 gp10 family phage protein n=1 Tax=Novosphingobium chloroacetimidivorans TaxID=1428314 RepID=A0A7W7NUG7_9SPHN|nr:HK97-gp10 family putative phage morphogenesis protein [Novosphingobium chloroacetimidivorans]MBB4857196.1 HK97 gp10 family phage protein [Novosphingobium chloroacetimidivorans]